MQQALTNIQVQVSRCDQTRVFVECRDRGEYQTAMAKWLDDKSNKYHWTVTFRHGCTNAFYHQSFNHLVERLNNLLFSKRNRYRNILTRIHGFAVRERNGQGDVHFHCIIQDPLGDLESKMSFERALEIAVPKITYEPMLYDVKAKNGKAKRLISNSGSKLQSYYNDGASKLENYVTKQFYDRRLTVQECLDNVGIFESDGAVFGGIYIK
ncbi:MAG: hypothetical protein V7745_00605 [Pseudomonadales bacterium]